MKTITVTIKDKLAIISFNRPKSNSLNKEMISELHQMLNDIENDPNIGAVIITGKDNFFSAGLDLIELYDYNLEEAKDFWHLFLKFVAKITAFKKPLIAAINGHCPAGGCVIALACDARIMAEGKFIIGLNEVPVGIIVPNAIFNLYAFWLGKANAAKNLLEGKLFHPADALAIGLVDELVNPESILTAAERKARKYMAFESNTWQQSKINIRKELIASTSADQTADLEIMLKQWWSPATRAILKTLIDSLQKK